MVFVLILTVFAGLIVAVTAGLILASFVFMKKLSDITAAQTTLKPLYDEPWADEQSIPAEIRDSMFIKHVDGPLFFGFASQYLDLSRDLSGGKLLVLRMDRITYVDQTGIYALQESLTNVTKAGLRVLIVGITVAHLDILRRFQVVPNVVGEQDIFHDFDELKRELPAIFGQLVSKRSSAAV
jgi:SulP family sulfate permease